MLRWERTDNILDYRCALGLFHLYCGYSVDSTRGDIIKVAVQVIDLDFRTNYQF